VTAAAGRLPKVPLDTNHRSSTQEKNKRGGALATVGGVAPRNPCLTSRWGRTRVPTTQPVVQRFRGGLAALRHEKWASLGRLECQFSSKKGCDGRHRRQARHPLQLGVSGEQSRPWAGPRVPPRHWMHRGCPEMDHPVGMEDVDLGNDVLEVGPGPGLTTDVCWGSSPVAGALCWSPSSRA
jgi:hypothetical protein